MLHFASCAPRGKAGLMVTSAEQHLKGRSKVTPARAPAKRRPREQGKERDGARGAEQPVPAPSPAHTAAPRSPAPSAVPRSPAAAVRSTSGRVLRPAELRQPCSDGPRPAGPRPTVPSLGGVVFGSTAREGGGAPPAVAAVGHLNVDVAVACTVGADRVWTADEDGGVQCRHLWTGAGAAVVPSRGARVTAMARLEAADAVALGTADGRVRVLRCAAPYEALQEHRLHAGAVTALAPAPSEVPWELYSCGEDGIVCAVRWGGEGGDWAAERMQGHGGPVRCLLPSGPHLYSGGDDRAVKLWDCATGDACVCLGDYVGHKGAVLALAASDAALFSAAADGTVRAWSPSTGKQLTVLRHHQGAVTSLACPPPGGMLWSAGEDGACHLYDTATFDRVGSVPQHQGGVVSLEASAARSVRLLWALTANGSVRLLAQRLTPGEAAELSPGPASVASRPRTPRLEEGAMEAADPASPPDHDAECATPRRCSPVEGASAEAAEALRQRGADRAALSEQAAELDRLREALRRSELSAQGLAEDRDAALAERDSAQSALGACRADLQRAQEKAEEQLQAARGARDEALKVCGRQQDRIAQLKRRAADAEAACTELRAATPRALHQESAEEIARLKLLLRERDEELREVAAALGAKDQQLGALHRAQRESAEALRKMRRAFAHGEGWLHASAEVGEGQRDRILELEERTRLQAQLIGEKSTTIDMLKGQLLRAETALRAHEAEGERASAMLREAQQRQQRQECSTERGAGCQTPLRRQGSVGAVPGSAARSAARDAPRVRSCTQVPRHAAGCELGAEGRGGAGLFGTRTPARQPSSTPPPPLRVYSPSPHAAPRRSSAPGGPPTSVAAPTTPVSVPRPPASPCASATPLQRSATAAAGPSPVARPLGWRRRRRRLREQREAAEAGDLITTDSSESRSSSPHRASAHSRPSVARRCPSAASRGSPVVVGTPLAEPLGGHALERPIRGGSAQSF
eukprot:TRINITY_DN2861_c1_g6_i1.p1 TRINITY_DN2861_c1_g6~~TRINITY_DN2861_c1_g6_i1.p1  ORF type:complete len:982 (+),score=270.45 TRINITY_DN2861_c1_g6_i1:46-2991(+)